MSLKLHPPQRELVVSVGSLAAPPQRRRSLPAQPIRVAGVSHVPAVASKPQSIELAPTNLTSLGSVYIPPPLASPVTVNRSLPLAASVSPVIPVRIERVQSPGPSAKRLAPQCFSPKMPKAGDEPPVGQLRKPDISRELHAMNVTYIQRAEVLGAPTYKGDSKYFRDRGSREDTDDTPDRYTESRYDVVQPRRKKPQENGFTCCLMED